MVDKKKAIEILIELKERIPAVSKWPRPNTGEFLKWQSDVKIAITTLFPPGAHFYQDFLNIAFRRHVKAGYPGNSDQDKTNAFQRGMGTAGALIQSMIDSVETYWDENQAAPGQFSSSSHEIAKRKQDAIAHDARSVFVVHGRNDALRDSMFQFLRAIGLNPIEWSQALNATGKGSPYVGEILDKAFSMAQAVVVLMTPDDFAWLKKEFQGEHDGQHEKEPTGQARANVLFEAGMAMGRCETRTILVEVGSLRPFSDVGGRHVLRLSNKSERRQDLAERLKTAGCNVDISGRDWHTVGSFEVAESASLGTGENLAPKKGTAPAGTPRPELRPEEIELINAMGDEGWVHVTDNNITGRSLATMDREFFDENDPSVQAKSLDALEALLAKGIVRLESAGHYKLTGRGFDLLKALDSSTGSIKN